MNNKKYAGIVPQGPTHTLNFIDEVQTEKSVQLINKTDKVFCVDAGRSGSQAKGFAMYLIHMGVTSYVAGETCTPNVKEGGVLVVCGESGEIKLPVNHATRAKEMGAWVVLIIINPNSSIVNMADAVIEISTSSPRSAKQGDIKSIQPMGPLFEQSEGTFMDVAITMLMRYRGKDSGMMFGRHANIE